MTDIRRNVFDMLMGLVGQYNMISYPAEMVSFTGSHDAAMLLSQLLYWTKHSKNNGWVYKKYVDWEKELRLSEYQVRKAKASLEKQGLIETEVRKAGGSPIVHYRILRDPLTDSILQFFKERPSDPKEPEDGSLKDYGNEPKESTESLTSNTASNTNSTHTIQHFVVAQGDKEDDSMATQHSLFKLPEKPAASLPKDASNAQIAMHHVSEARAGRRAWDKVTDRDFTHYFINRHNDTMPKLVSFDMYTSITIIRDSLINGYDIPREKVCDYIDTILVEYQNHPDNQTWLSFNMIQKNGPLMNQLIELARRKLQPVERKFQTNVAPMKLGKVEEGETF